MVAGGLIVEGKVEGRGGGGGGGGRVEQQWGSRFEVQSMSSLLKGSAEHTLQRDNSKKQREQMEFSQGRTKEAHPWGPVQCYWWASFL